MEYLMSYSWALLIVIIIGVVVWQMGLLDLSGKEMPGYSGFSVVVPVDWEMTYMGSSQCTFSALLANAAGEDLGNIAIDNTTCTPNNISAGERTTCSKTVILGSCSDRGKAYDETVIVTYTRMDTGENFQSAGTFWGSIS